MNALSILIVEDNLDLAANTGEFLTAHGLIADFAYDGRMAMSLVDENRYDLVLLDLMLPKSDGCSVARHIRAKPIYTPIIMLTAKDTIDSKLEGFDAGADDYVLKPFSLQELLARIYAQAGRHRNNKNSHLSLGDIELDVVNQTLKVASNFVSLGRNAFRILEVLLCEHPNLVARPDLEKSLWGDLKPDSDSLRSHAYNLRKALKHANCAYTVQNEHGRGYRLAKREVKEGFEDG